MDKLNIEQLKNLLLGDPHKFMELVLSILKEDRDLAFSDSTPKETKIRAIDRMIARFEKIERYEDCLFLKQIKDELND